MLALVFKMVFKMSKAPPNRDPKNLKTRLGRESWDRRILTYRENPRGPETIDQEMLTAEWNMHLFRLQTPVLVKRGLISVIDYNDIRVYPPFEIDRGLASSQSLLGSRIPLLEGCKELNPPVISHPIINFDKHTAICYGLRVDLRRKISPVWDGLPNLLNLLRETSLQWWINSHIDPFDLGSKFIVEIEDNGSFSDGPLKTDQRSPWHPAVSTKRPLGWETVVDEVCWKKFALCLSSNKVSDMATTTFLDAVSSYMSEMDFDCIYKLCLSLEIMESKLRSARGNPTNSYALKLLKNAHLWKTKDKSLLKKMFVDRGHIAHGEKPPFYSSDENLIVGYLDLGKSYYERFLKQAREIGWSKISNL